MENGLIMLTTEFNACKMKNASEDPTLWYAELHHIHQHMQQAGVKEKSDTKMIAQIMTKISKAYKVAAQAICIMPAANRIQVYVDLWNAKYKNKVQSDMENIALYVEMKKNWK